MTRTCEYCGLPFDPYEVDAEGRTNYCSDACHDADYADDYDGPDDGEAWDGGFADNH